MVPLWWSLCHARTADGWPWLQVDPPHEDPRPRTGHVVRPACRLRRLDCGEVIPIPLGIPNPAAALANAGRAAISNAFGDW